MIRVPSKQKLLFGIGIKTVMAPTLELANTIHFKYLSVWMSLNKYSIEDEEIGHRIECARVSFIQHCKMLQTSRH